MSLRPAISRTRAVPTMEGAGVKLHRAFGFNEPELFAGSAGGISPPAAHRSGLDTLASSGSCHRLKAAAFRRDTEFLLSPVDSHSTSVTHPLHSSSITEPSSLLWGGPNLTGASVLSASRGHRLRLFPYHHRPGSQVPCESPDESHASYTPDAAWPVSRLPPCLSRSSGETPVLTPSKAISMLHQRFACARLSHPYMT